MDTAVRLRDVAQPFFFFDTVLYEQLRCLVSRSERHTARYEELGDIRRLEKTLVEGCPHTGNIGLNALHEHRKGFERSIRHVFYLENSALSSCRSRL